MEMVWTILIGLAAGTLAKILMPGKDPGGFIITILLGIAGSFFLLTWESSQVCIKKVKQPGSLVQ